MTISMDNLDLTIINQNATHGTQTAIEEFPDIYEQVDLAKSMNEQHFNISLVNIFYKKGTDNIWHTAYAQKMTELLSLNGFTVTIENDNSPSSFPPPYKFHEAKGPWLRVTW